MSRRRWPIHAVVALLAVGLIAPAWVVVGGGKAWAQSENEQRFIPLGRLPTLLLPGGNRPPQFRRSARPVNFFVEAETLRNSIDQPLSTACAHGEFNLKDVGRYYVTIGTDETAPRRYGYADSTGFNLRDPKNQAVADTVYLFELDATSECRVYAIAAPG